MSQYYYLAAQLPQLSFDRAPGISSERFLDEACKWLPDKDFQALSSAGPDNFQDFSRDTFCVSEYKQFERSLRRNLAALRKSGGVGSVVSGSNPLEQEKNLLLRRWRFIEDLESGHCFDFDFLFLYRLKLNILETLFSFDKDTGLAKFDTYSEAVL